MLQKMQTSQDSERQVNSCQKFQRVGNESLSRVEMRRSDFISLTLVFLYEIASL